MKFSELWLREWVNPAISTEDLAHKLTMAGLEVDAVVPVAGAFSQVVVGRIKEITPHPDAEKLRVCKVDVGTDNLLTIVCGASNAREGLIVPVALVGAKLPGGMEIKKAKLRGVESFGMLCSAKELAMEESADGLMELSPDAPIGKDFRDYLWLDDNTIELGLTPNRGDCLSIAGIAREVGTLCQTTITPDEAKPVKVESEKRLSVHIEAAEGCPRYVCQVIEGINPQAVAPQWIKEALRRSGVRSISPVVDITNFVMLELGQPMHGFDLDTLNKGIIVRHSRAGESLELLDGQTIELKAGSLVIADHDKPLALAGIMGGEQSSVTSKTCNILLESAFFSPQDIAGKARGYGLHTDSSHRFERGVDPELQVKAMQRACSMLLEIVGGKAGPVVEAVYKESLPVRNSIKLRTARIERVLGQAIDGEIVKEILSRLGMQVTALSDGWQVQPPSFRFDMEIEEDLIEEVARIYGYDQLPVTLPSGDTGMISQAESQIPVDRLKDILVARGYQEAITYSFVDPKLQAILAPGEAVIPLANPISAEMSVMRTSHWPGLIQAVLFNLNRQQESVKFFESGLKFLKQGTDIKQEGYLSAVVTGNRYPEQWGVKSQPIDFFDVKNDLEALLALHSRAERYTFQSYSHPALHPGQSAEIIDDSGRQVGCMGALHPRVESELGLTQRVFVYELALNCFDHADIPVFQAASKFPSIRRDIAVVVDEKVSIAELKHVVKMASTGLLNNFQLFDVYQGKGIDSGRKSIAFGLTFQDQARTLVETDVEAAMAPILSALADQFGATLRE